MGTKHKPEPWRNVTGYYGEGLIYSGTTDKVPLPLAKAESTKDGDRLVACVNACAGINPEAVPDMLEALRKAEAHLLFLRLNSGIPDASQPELAAAHNAARAAIAKATGAQQD